MANSEYNLTVVDGTALTISLSGPVGPAGATGPAGTGGGSSAPVAHTATTAAIDVASSITALTTTAPDQQVTLANGVAGQTKTITHVARSNSGTAVLTVTSALTYSVGYQTIIFTNLGDTVTLQYYSEIGWVIVSIRGATAPATA